MVNLTDTVGEQRRPITDLPQCFHVEIIKIPLRDGVELSARLWLPDDALSHPVPAVIEYIPYRHRDYLAGRDSLIHPWFAGHGYAALRVDMRGSGDSDGVPMDEYVAQEQDDALQMLDYLSRRPWCSGATGLMGISWGGFNALQIAAYRPASLKAIVTLCSTDNRYTGDVHYPGGCLVSDNLTWGTLGFANMCRAPDPLTTGERWRELWFDRLEHAPFPLANWLSHQTRDDYWKHGSVCEDYDAIDCAVFAIGGWADSYTNAIPRLMRGLSSPRRALIGPWGHAYPHLATPAPRVDFLGEATRWWDRWLKGIDNGADAGPTFTTFLQAPAEPCTSYSRVEGQWIDHDHWPPEGAHNLEVSVAESGPMTVKTPPSLGAFAGEWMPLGAGPEYPADQNAEDAGAACFESEPLSQDLHIIGAPIARLRVSVDAPVAQVSVRLSDVAPDGRATRITYGVLNLTHRHSHEHPKPMVTGEPFDVQIPLNDVARTVPAGHRLRYSIATTQWPMFWPSPTLVCMTLHPEACKLVVTACPEPNRSSSPPASAVAPVGPDIDWHRPVEHRRIIETDLSDQTTTVRYHRDEGAFSVREHGMRVDSVGLEEHSIVDADPCSARGRVRWRLALSRDGWQTAIECNVEQSATAEAFLLSMRLEAFESGRRVFSRSESKRLPRHCL